MGTTAGWTTTPGTTTLDTTTPGTTTPDTTTTGTTTPGTIPVTFQATFTSQKGKISPKTNPPNAKAPVVNVKSNSGSYKPITFGENNMAMSRMGSVRNNLRSKNSTSNTTTIYSTTVVSKFEKAELFGFEIKIPIESLNL